MLVKLKALSKIGVRKKGTIFSAPRYIAKALVALQRAEIHLGDTQQVIVPTGIEEHANLVENSEGEINLQSASDANSHQVIEVDGHNTDALENTLTEEQNAENIVSPQSNENTPDVSSANIAVIEPRKPGRPKRQVPAEPG